MRGAGKHIFAATQRMPLLRGCLFSVPSWVSPQPLIQAPFRSRALSAKSYVLILLPECTATPHLVVSGRYSRLLTATPLTPTVMSTQRSKRAFRSIAQTLLQTLLWLPLEFHVEPRSSPCPVKSYNVQPPEVVWSHALLTTPSFSLDPPAPPLLKHGPPSPCRWAALTCSSAQNNFSLEILTFDFLVKCRFLTELTPGKLGNPATFTFPVSLVLRTLFCT